MAGDGRIGLIPGRIVGRPMARGAGHPIGVRLTAQIAITSADRVTDHFNQAATGAGGADDRTTREPEKGAQAIHSLGVTIKLNRMVGGGEPAGQGHGLIRARIDLEPRGHVAVDHGLEIHGRRALGPQFHRDRAAVHRGDESSTLPGKSNCLGVGGVNSTHPSGSRGGRHARAAAARGTARGERARDGGTPARCPVATGCQGATRSRGSPADRAAADCAKPTRGAGSTWTIGSPTG